MQDGGGGGERKRKFPTFLPFLADDKVKNEKESAMHDCAHTTPFAFLLILPFLLPKKSAAVPFFYLRSLSKRSSCHLNFEQSPCLEMALLHRRRKRGEIEAYKRQRSSYVLYTLLEVRREREKKAHLLPPIAV